MFYTPEAQLKFPLNVTNTRPNLAQSGPTEPRFAVVAVVKYLYCVRFVEFMSVRAGESDGPTGL